ncbi:MAG: hypothetical protein AAFR47_21530 [Pseudomonadota bacterium]
MAIPFRLLRVALPICIAGAGALGLRYGPPPEDLAHLEQMESQGLTAAVAFYAILHSAMQGKAEQSTFRSSSSGMSDGLAALQQRQSGRGGGLFAEIERELKGTHVGGSIRRTAPTAQRKTIRVGE